MKKLISAAAAFGFLLASPVFACGIDWVRPQEGNSFEPYFYKVDLARAEFRAPIPEEKLKTLKPEDLLDCPQEALDQLYAKLSAGPIPNAAFAGRVVFSSGDGIKEWSRRLHQAEDIRSGGSTDVEGHFKRFQRFAEGMWAGKHFYRDRMILKNMMNPTALRALGVSTDGLTRTEVGGRTMYEVFPAKLYCGQSLFDSRRESIIIDYAFNDDIRDEYRDNPDRLANRFGLLVRDEIRMVRPGFYIGRAYMHRQFGLNFFLYNKELDQAGGPVKEDCWPGTQDRKWPSWVAGNR